MSFHISANPGEIAETVFISGDPLRAKFMANLLLDEPKCYNEVRGMLGYTGYYNNQKVSFQGTGMGMPSTAIYVHELITDYNVKKIVRLGSCGALQKDLSLGSVICATAASGDSYMIDRYVTGGQYAAIPDTNLLKQSIQVSKELNEDILFGPIFSSDCFYDPRNDDERWSDWVKQGILAVEMESQILYAIGAHFGIQTISFLTVSDNIIAGTFISSEERETSFSTMTKFALNAVL